MSDLLRHDLWIRPHPWACAASAIRTDPGSGGRDWPGAVAVPHAIPAGSTRNSTAAEQRP